MAEKLDLIADVQVITVHMKYVQRDELAKSLARKMAPPLGASGLFNPAGLPDQQSL